MRKISTSFKVACVAAAGLMGAAAHAADEPVNMIKYRQAAMTAMSGHLGMLSAIAKGEISFTDEAAIHAEAINNISKNLERMFPEGSGFDAGKTNALNDIWEKPDDFKAAVAALQNESAKLVEVAQSGDAAAIGAQVGSLGKNACGNCHNTFRHED